MNARHHQAVAHSMTHGGLPAVSERQRSAIGAVQREDVRTIRQAGYRWEHALRLVGGHHANVGDFSVAEWVQDQQTVEILRAAGIDFLQGYFCGEPALAETFGINRAQ